MSHWRLRTAIVAAGAAVMAMAATSTPVAAGPSQGGLEPFASCPGGGEVAVDAGPASSDDDASTVEVAAVSDCPPMEVTARVGGVTARHRFEASPEGVADRFSFDPCKGGGGSDLPGTGVEVTGRSGSVTVGGTLPLGPDTTAPTVKKIQSAPPPGSEVKSGEKIKFSEGDVVGRERRSGATWQTGVQSIQLLAPEGLVKGAHAEAKSNRPLPCDKKQWTLGTPAAVYKVPKGATGAIRICAVAVDFAGNTNGDTCATYYVGEVWEGTIREHADVVDVGNPCSWTYEGPVQLVVAPDGSLTGSVNAAFTEVMEDPASPCLAVPVGAQFTQTISGSRDRNRFNVFVNGPTGSLPLELSIAGKKAEGSTLVGGYIDTTMNLTCKTCDKKVG